MPILHLPSNIDESATVASITAAQERTALGSTTVGDAVFIAANAGAARTAIGAVIGTDVQAQSSNLTAVAGLTSGASLLAVWTGSGTAANDDWDRTPTSWTPVLEGTTTAGTHSYDHQVGKAWRRGKLILLEWRLHLSGKNTSGGAMAGNIRIGGIPYTSANTTDEFGGAFFTQAEQIAFGGFLGGVINPNTTKLDLYNNTSGTGTSPANIVAANIGLNPGFIGWALMEAA